MPGGRFAEKFSDEQRAAIVSAILDEGLSPYRATDRARDGRLAELPAFDMSPSYAYQIARRETRKRAGDAPGPTNQTADERLDRTAQRMAASLDALQRAWDKKRTRRPLELEQLAKAGIAIRRFLGGDTVAQSRQSPWSRRSPSDRKDAGAGPDLARIMAEHQATAGQSAPAPQPAARARSSGGPANAANGNAHNTGNAEPAEAGTRPASAARADLMAALARIDGEGKA